MTAAASVLIGISHIYGSIILIEYVVVKGRLVPGCSIIPIQVLILFKNKSVLLLNFGVKSLSQFGNALSNVLVWFALKYIYSLWFADRGCL